MKPVLWRSLLAVLILALLIPTISCSSDESGETPKPTITATPIATEMPTPTLTPTPTPTPTLIPVVNTYVELTSITETDQNGIQVDGVTNLPDGAILSVWLLLFDAQGNIGKNRNGQTLSLEQSMVEQNPSVENGKYSVYYDLSYYAGGKCRINVEFYPHKEQPAFISNAFGENGRNMTGARIVTSPPYDWGVMVTDDDTFYRCLAHELYWYPAGVPTPTATSSAMLKLISWSWHVEYGYAIVEGQVQNISNQRLEHVEALVNYYTSSEEFITSDDALIEYDPIMPNQISPFKVLTPHNPMMDKAGVSFKYLMGGSIPFTK